jgi:broad specificity phosphatase PhoE
MTPPGRRRLSNCRLLVVPRHHAARASPEHLVLVKHAQPVLAAGVPPKDWRLSEEGERQSTQLARHLARFAPLRLIASQEPKALTTARLAAATLAVDVAIATGLEEFDRPALPIVPRAEHERVNAAIFRNPSARVLGRESARDALGRFSEAMAAELGRTAARTLVAVTHGTVIALFVAAHNPVDPFDLWARLACPSYVVLDLPSFALGEVVSPLPD